MTDSPTPASGRVRTSGASKRTSVAESTLRYWRHVGKGPLSYSVGNKIWYDISDLDAWLAAQKEATKRGGTP